METWLPVPGWGDLYEVSDAGNVRSRDRAICVRNPHGEMGRRKYAGRPLAAPVAQNGYRVVCFTRPGRRQHFYVHALVLLAFVGPCPPLHEVCHGDGVKINNVLSNLRYDTRSGNAQDTLRHGSRRAIRGEGVAAAKLTEAAVRYARQNPDNLSARALARKFGVSHNTMLAVLKNKSWTHVV